MHVTTTHSAVDGQTDSGRAWADMDMDMFLFTSCCPHSTLLLYYLFACFFLCFVDDGGYAGAWGWQANGGGPDADPFSVLLRGIASVAANRAGAMDVDLFGASPASFSASASIDEAVVTVDDIPDLDGAAGPEDAMAADGGDTTGTDSRPFIIGVTCAAAVLILAVGIGAIMYRRNKLKARVQATQNTHMQV